jgi:hypothetical protein
MPKLALFQLLASVGLALIVPSENTLAQLQQLANRVPESANALVIIDVKSAYASPLSQAHGWDQQGLQDQSDGMIALPVGTEFFLMAAEMDFEFMQPHWEIAVAHMRPMPSMDAIANHSGGRLDRLAGTQAVERPNDSYVVTLGPRVLGAMSPANRQQVIRWVRKSRSRKSPQLSPYLSEVLNKVLNKVLKGAKSDDALGDGASPIVMALDLHGILAAAEIGDKLTEKESLLNKALKGTVDIAELSKVIASIRGIRLEVHLQNPAQGQLTLDFDQDAAVLDKFAKRLLLAVLAKHGATIDDFKNWDVHTAGKSIGLQGELSPSGLRRILSVLSSPVGPMAPAADASGSASDAMAIASQRYFQTITHYLNDLFASNLQPQSLYQMKTWVERYARKIEGLDTQQVDKDLVAFGRDVVDSLHEIVSVVDRAEKRSDLRESTLNNYGRSRYGRYGAYGHFEKSYVTRDRQLVQADEANRGIQEAHVIVNELRTLSTQTRNTMADRYGRKF